MKLNSNTVDRTLDQVEATVIPEDHPASAQLNSVFGDHTFFLAATGLLIVEPVAAEPDGADHQTGKLVKLAEWNEGRTGLVPHPPEPTEVEVSLEPEKGGSAA